MNLDQELQDALRRKPAPDDLADRVLARIANESARRGEAKPKADGVLRWLAAAAAVIIAAGAGEHYYMQQRQAAEAARAQQEIRLALQITSQKLAFVQSKISTPAENGRR
jgi:hypothetical protein